MIGGLTFMFNNKMCVGIIKDDLMCRIDPGLHNVAVEKNGCRTMDFTKRRIKLLPKHYSAVFGRRPTMEVVHSPYMLYK